MTSLPMKWVQTTYWSIPPKSIPPPFSLAAQAPARFFLRPVRYLDDYVLCAHPYEVYGTSESPDVLNGVTLSHGGSESTLESLKIKVHKECFPVPEAVDFSDVYLVECLPGSEIPFRTMASYVQYVQEATLKGVKIIEKIKHVPYKLSEFLSDVSKFSILKEVFAEHTVEQLKGNLQLLKQLNFCVSDTSRRRSVLWQHYHPFPLPTADAREDALKARIHGNALALLYFREIGYDDCNFEHGTVSKFPRSWNDAYSFSEIVTRKNQNTFDITSPSLAVKTNCSSEMVVKQNDFDHFLGALLRSDEGSKQAAYVAFGYVENVVDYAEQHGIALFIFTKDVDPSYYETLPPLSTVHMYPESEQEQIIDRYKSLPPEHCPKKNGAIFPFNAHAKTLAERGPGEFCQSFMSHLGVSTSITEELLKKRDAEVEELRKQLQERDAQLQEQATQLKDLQGPGEKRARV